MREKERYIYTELSNDSVKDLLMAAFNKSIRNDYYIERVAKTEECYIVKLALKMVL